MSSVSESTVKAATLDRLGGISWPIAYGPGIVLDAVPFACQRFVRD